MTQFNPTHRPNFYLLGHRGMRAECLENSQLGFVHAQQLRPTLNGVEFDVQLTADHELVVVHDAHLQRLGGLQRSIYQSTLAQLQTIPQSDWAKFYLSKNPEFLAQPILPLVDLFPLLTSYEHIELEVKTHQASDYQALARALFNVLDDPDWHALNITITSFDTAFLTTFLSLAQPLYGAKLPPKTGLLLEPKTTLASEIAFLPTDLSQIYAVCNLACRLGCSQIGVYFALITPELVQIAQRFNLTVTAWTVNEIAIAKRLISWGVTAIITDFPSEFCRLLK